MSLDNIFKAVKYKIYNSIFLLFLVVITEDPTNGGFVDLIQSQPAVIAGVAIGLLIIIALVVGGICYYKKSKRSRKARGLHGKKGMFSTILCFSNIYYT